MVETELLDFCRDEGVPFLEHAPLSGYTTLRIGGPARVLLLPETVSRLVAVLAWAMAHGQRYAVIGRGSNLLVPDEGYDGAVIRTPSEPPRWHSDGCTVTASAGCSLSSLATEAARRGLSGLAFAQGIPGSVGGAVVMNAGAYGGQIADVLVSSRVAGPEGVFTLSAPEHRLSYRHSVYAERPQWVCLEATFCLAPGDRTALEAEMAQYARLRREKQPLEWPSAGSTFKRPEGFFAGKLIEEAGLKGFSVGGAQVSEKHAGFVINRGNATCADMQALMEQVSQKVYERFGVRLEPEVRLLK